MAPLVREELAAAELNGQDDRWALGAYREILAARDTNFELLFPQRGNSDLSSKFNLTSSRDQQLQSMLDSSELLRV
jgi:hypothetical protein